MIYSIRLLFNSGLFTYQFFSFSAIVAIVVPELDLLISLVGALASSSLALVFPPLIEILTYKAPNERLSSLSVIKDISIMVFGVFGCVVGTWVSIDEIRKKLQITTPSNSSDFTFTHFHHDLFIYMYWNFYFLSSCMFILFDSPPLDRSCRGGGQTVRHCYDVSGSDQTHCDSSLCLQVLFHLHRFKKEYLYSVCISLYICIGNLRRLMRYSICLYSLVCYRTDIIQK